MFIGLGLTLSASGMVGVGSAADPLETMLAELETAGKLLSAWYLPLAEPTRYLTLDGPNVIGFAAPFGTQKCDLAELTNPPQWDATLFGGKGGLTFDGLAQCLTGTTNVANWPGTNDTLSMLAAVRQDRASGVAGTLHALTYGATGSSYRAIRRENLSSISRAAAALPTNATSAAVFNGAHTVGGRWTNGATTRAYIDGVNTTSGSATPSALTLTRVRIGASAAAVVSSFWEGAIACAAILGPTASEADFLALEAVMRTRIT